MNVNGRVEIPRTADEKELARLWALGRVTHAQVQRATKKDPNSTYILLATGLKQLLKELYDKHELHNE
jgi:hypothetical protein